MRAILKIQKNLIMLLNDDTVDIEKPGGICSRTFVDDELSGLYLIPSIFFIKHSKST